MMRWLFASAASSLLSMVVFSVGMIFFFPSEWVKDQISHQVQSQSRKKTLIHIEDASISGLMGIALDGVSLFESKPGRRKPGQKERPARVNTLLGSVDSITLQPQLFSWLTGTLATGLSVSLAGGDIDASFGMSDGQYVFGTDVDDFNLQAHPIAMDGGSVELSGALDLVTNLVIDRNDIKASTGNLELTVENLRMLNGIIGGFDLGQMSFTEAILQMEVNDGKAEITKGSFVGDLVEATIEGHITLRKDLGRSRLALNILVRFDDTLDKLAKIALKSSRDDDGVYHFKGQGTVMNPRFKADRIKRGQSSKAGDAAYRRDADEKIQRKASRSSQADRSSSSDEDREERRTKRRERLRKRRDRMKKRREERRERSSESETRRTAGNNEPYDEADNQYDDEDAEQGNYPPVQNLPPPIYEDEIEPEYNDGPNDDYDANGPNGNLEDLGYIDD
jgi:type II secretion system protein N